MSELSRFVYIKSRVTTHVKIKSNAEKVKSDQLSDNSWILPVCYISQLNSTSERLLSDLMWFLHRFCHIRYVEFVSFRNLIGFFSLSCLYL